MAYGSGRPAIIREDETIHQCRRLLDHPLSITSDARLVSTVELTALRCKCNDLLVLDIADGFLQPPYILSSRQRRIFPLLRVHCAD